MMNSRKLFNVLCDSVKAMQAEMVTLKSEVTHSDKNSRAGSQNSVIVSSNGPMRKRTAPEEESNTDDDDDDDDDDDGSNDEMEDDAESELYQLSEEAGAFIETAFKSKLDNTTRKARATKFGVPDSRWLKCPKLDPVVSTTIPLAAH